MAETIDWLEFRAQIRVFSKALSRRKPIAEKQFLHPDPQKKLTVMVQKKLVNRTMPNPNDDLSWWEQE